MTEKRFIIDNDYDIVEFDYHNNEYIQYFMFTDGKSWGRICNRLNELAEENEQLKSEIKLLRQKETTSKLNEIQNSTMESFLKKQR